MNKKRIQAFDLIRVFACLCVITIHFNYNISAGFTLDNTFIPNTYLKGQVYLGDIGVCLFFMLSGATQMLSYKEGNLYEYYWKRIINLFPMFWIAYIIATILDALFLGNICFTNPRLLTVSFFGLDGYYATKGMLSFGCYKLGEWFMGCIVLLYLISPFLYSALKNKRSEIACWVFFITIYWLVIESKLIDWMGISNITFFLRVPEFLFGMTFVKYELWKSKNLWGLASFFFIVVVLFYLFPGSATGLTVAIFFCACLFSIFVLLNQKFPLPGIEKPLSFIASLTYSVFLVHHWSINRACVLIDLKSLSKFETVIIYVLFVLFSFFAGYCLKKLTDMILSVILPKVNNHIKKPIVLCFLAGFVLCNLLIIIRKYFG